MGNNGNFFTCKFWVQKYGCNGCKFIAAVTANNTGFSEQSINSHIWAGEVHLYAKKLPGFRLRKNQL